MANITKWAVGGAASIGLVVGAAKSLRDITENLNGWEALLIFSVIVLCVLAVGAYRVWLDSRFDMMRREMRDGFKKEAASRGGSHFRALTWHTDLEKRVKALEDSVKPPAPTVAEEVTSLGSLDPWDS